MDVSKTRRALGGAHVPPTKLFRRVIEQELSYRKQIVCKLRTHVEGIYRPNITP